MTAVTTTSLDYSPPAPATLQLVWHYAAHAGSVGVARRDVGAQLRLWGLGEMTDTALVVSELTSNAVKASRPDEVVAVRLTAADGTLLVEVWDSGDGAPALATPADEEESGRGLLIVAALCDRTGWYAAKTGGKVVWARFPAELRLPPAAGDGEVSPMPSRTPVPGPDGMVPVSFADDPALLRRVADGLRALGDWHPPADRLLVERAHRPLCYGSTG